MAIFAKLKVGNIVEKVVSVSNDVAPTEQAGEDFLNKLYNTRDAWIQTSSNTYGGVHRLGGTPLRKNYAGIGFFYDQAKDVFIPPQEFPSWTLNEDTCLWEAPVAYPNDGKNYRWNEETTNWEEIT